MNGIRLPQAVCFSDRWHRYGASASWPYGLFALASNLSIALQVDLMQPLPSQRILKVSKILGARYAIVVEVGA